MDVQILLYRGSTEISAASCVSFSSSWEMLSSVTTIIIVEVEVFQFESVVVAVTK